MRLRRKRHLTHPSLTCAHDLSFAIFAQALFTPLKRFRRSTPAQMRSDDDTGTRRERGASSVEQHDDAQQHQRRLERLEEIVHDLQMAIRSLENRVQILSVDVEQMRGRPTQAAGRPTQAAAIKTCDSFGCNRRYGPDRYGYLHPFCCKTCAKQPCLHGPRCGGRCYW